MSMTKLGELAAQFASLIEQKKKNEISAKDLAQQIAGLEEQLLEELSDNGLQNTKLENGMVLYRAVDKFYGHVDDVTKDQFITELARHDQTRDLVEPNYNANSLRARMKEIEANGELLPESLQKMVRITERDRVRHRS